ncbi:MAG TPA: polysaccharide deacetylase family protein [Bryobacteraceae bacterium]|jgi:peptidoglycan/xylan/chitin deacetylase (PgdA/CDA1 family)|nr:polysaccharide deacetylase family protein [Bryobacteraceae bacterium]
MMWQATAAGCAAGAGAACMAWAVRGRSSSVFAPSVWRGTSGRRSIALTFDDGPSESTPAILSILRKHDVRATFFQCGRNARRLSSIAREVALAGHEIGNHTETHPRLWLRSPQFIRSEIARAQESIEAAAGVKPALFRPPYGVRWFGLRGALREFGLTGVMWTVIGLDWKNSAGKVAERLLRGAGGGVIFCLHDGRGLEVRPDTMQTSEALERVLPILRAKGYHFETVSQITCQTI